MTEVMLNMVALILKGIKSFVLNLPTASTASNQVFDVIFTDRDVAHPAVVVGAFSFNNKAVLKIVYIVGIFCPV